MENSLKVTVVENPATLSGMSILRTLLYFDLFHYPLTLEEIYLFSGQPVDSLEQLVREISRLEKCGLVFRFHPFYCLQNDDSNCIRRVKGNREAEKYIPMARERAKLLSRFPFIRAVMASGSLSKGYMDEKSDLDFFVVTEPNRLWIARTLFILYRKLFVPLSRYKEFCTNYFIASDHLEIEEKNLFTATELITLIPLYNMELYTHLLSANGWTNDYFPNFRKKEYPDLNFQENKFKKGLEKLISLFFRSRTDQLLMGISLKRFTQQHAHKFTPSEFSQAFKTRNYVSKGHLGNHQTRVLSLLQERTKSLEARYAIAYPHG
ncbi:MAG TPA: hypothetical protein PLR06_13305 [Cyclobacteriaceae bacterium]|nr:hypothetical protein [Cyclobacteriaceae bacterium]